MVNIFQIKNEPANWSITLSSNGTPISYKIDTGAQCNVIPVEILENISPKPDLQPVNVKLSTYNGSKIPVVGKCSLTLDKKIILLKFHSYCRLRLCTYSRVKNKGTFTTYKKN